ncbi:MAG: hypothetical protein MK135_08975, partial [Polyangiaceae bacterium]|nr:hypothetical protein [Polyangiaceae bacterium]
MFLPRLKSRRRLLRTQSHLAAAALLLFTAQLSAQEAEAEPQVDSKGDEQKVGTLNLILFIETAEGSEAQVSPSDAVVLFQGERHPANENGSVTINNIPEGQHQIKV